MPEKLSLEGPGSEPMVQTCCQCDMSPAPSTLTELDTISDLNRTAAQRLSFGVSYLSLHVPEAGLGPTDGESHSKDTANFHINSEILVS